MRPVTGRFVVTWMPTVAGTGATSFVLDLFDDGSVDATSSTVIPVVLPAGLTLLRVQTSASASAGVFSGPWNMQISYQGMANGALAIRFEPVHCTVAVCLVVPRA